MDKDLVATITEIRHEHTNYDKLSVYYHVHPWARRKLNRLIILLIQGAINIPMWRAQVTELEESIDLSRRRAQKLYIRAESRRFRESGYYTDIQAKKMAQSNLASVLKAQQTMNAGIYDPHLFDNKFTPLKDRYRK